MNDKYEMDPYWFNVMNEEMNTTPQKSESDLLRYINNNIPFDDLDDEREEFLTEDEIKKKLGITTDKEPEPGIIGRKISSNEPAEENVYFKIFNQEREMKYTDAEMEKIRNSCKGVIVHDYGHHDIYHMSDEYIREHDVLNEMSDKLNTIKSSYNKVDQWIYAMRTIIEAWELLESKSNYMYTKNEFFDMVANGHIVSSGLITPKLRKMKNYDMDTLIKYISNPELDPTDLIPIDQKQPYDPEDVFYSIMDEPGMEDKSAEEIQQIVEQRRQEDLRRIMDEEMCQYVLDHIDKPEGIKVKIIDNKYLDTYNESNYGAYGKKKKKKKLNKKQRDIKSVQEILHKIEDEHGMSSNRGFVGYNSFMATSNMFESQTDNHDWIDDFRYNGSWTDDNGLYLYRLQMYNQFLEQPVPLKPYMKFRDIGTQQFFSTLQDNGVNVVNLRRKMNEVVSEDGSVKHIVTDNRKDLKKMENKIIQRITKLNNNDKFKKLIKKAENAINKQNEGY